MEREGGGVRVSNLAYDSNGGRGNKHLSQTGRDELSFD